MELVVEVLALLLLTRVCGEGAERLGQSASVGEMLAGVGLAAVATLLAGGIPFLDRLIRSEALDFAANLGIFFLVLFAGVEMEPKKMAAYSGAALAVAVGGAVLPLVAGFALAWFYLPEGELKLVQASLVGVAIAISAVPATVKVLMDFRLLEQHLGQVVVAAAVFDDILGLLLLAVLISQLENGALPSLAEFGWLLGKVVAFFALTIALGVHVYPRLSRKIAEMEAAALEFSSLIAAAMAYALLAEWLGLHWVLGPFMAGLFFEPQRVGKRVHGDMILIVGTIAGGVLGPLFFLNVGLEVDLRALGELPMFFAALLVVAMLGKVVGAGLPARLLGFERRQALGVGVAMSARGGVGLIVLSIAEERGFFADGGPSGQLFSVLVLATVATTVLAPMLLKRVLHPASPP